MRRRRLSANVRNRIELIDSLVAVLCRCKERTVKRSVSIHRKMRRFDCNGSRTERTRNVNSSFMTQPSAKRTPGIRSDCASPWFASFY